MDHNANRTNTEVENVYSYAYDGPRSYNYEPVRCPRDQQQTVMRRNKGYWREIEFENKLNFSVSDWR